MVQLQVFPPGMTYPAKQAGGGDVLRQITAERDRLARQIEMLKPRSRRRIALEERIRMLTCRQLRLELRAERTP